MKNLSLILACDEKKGLGKNGNLAWNISSDLKYFKKITVSTKKIDAINVVVMGRKTWDSIPQKYRPLPGRINAVLTRNKGFKDKGCITFSSIEELLKEVNKLNNVENIFIIGGANIYNQVLKQDILDKIYLTRVEGDFSCDVFFDGIPKDFILESESDIQEEEGIRFRFQVYKKNK